MAKYKAKFVCQECGYESVKWIGKCPGCGAWASMVEEVVSSPSLTHHHGYGTEDVARVESIHEIDTRSEPRVLTGYAELDRVLGGGIVPGSLVLVGGDPGIGKSTLLLQISHAVAEAGNTVLYVSGEESARQIKMRADRLDTLSERLYILPETDLERMEEWVKRVQPQFLMIDSIQTVYRPSVSSAPGSVSQVRECTAYLLRLAKTQHIATFIIGHVTKEGMIAGPRMLEHMVDAVLYFEGEQHHTYRILRAVKNRFGSTHEMGIFEMKEKGLVEVANPSELFLSERPRGVAGSAVVASMEGTRPVLVEVQALVSQTVFGNPRRTATGVDHHRVSMLMAVLEKRVGLYLSSYDAFVNVAGGMRLDEPAADMGVALAIASSYKDQAVPAGDVYIGEIGLTGEVRGVSRIEQRVREAKKLGFSRCIIPVKNARGWSVPEGIQVIGVETVQEVLQVALRG